MNKTLPSFTRLQDRITTKVTTRKGQAQGILPQHDITTARSWTGPDRGRGSKTTWTRTRKTTKVQDAASSDGSDTTGRILRYIRQRTGDSRHNRNQHQGEDSHTEITAETGGWEPSRSAHRPPSAISATSTASAPILRAFLAGRSARSLTTLLIIYSRLHTSRQAIQSFIRSVISLRLSADSLGCALPVLFHCLTLYTTTLRSRLDNFLGILFCPTRYAHLALL